MDLRAPSNKILLWKKLTNLGGYLEVSNFTSRCYQILHSAKRVLSSWLIKLFLFFQLAMNSRAGNLGYQRKKILCFGNMHSVVFPWVKTMVLVWVWRVKNLDFQGSKLNSSWNRKQRDGSILTKERNQVEGMIEAYALSGSTTSGNTSLAHKKIRASRWE